MHKSIVVGLDSSTQSAKAIAWTAEGQCVAEGRADIPMHHPKPGYAEQSPSDWWHAACSALQDLTAQIDTARIGALGVSNQRETVAFFDAEGFELHPAITWLDDRSLEEIPLLTTEFGTDRLHHITGRPPIDATVAVHSLSWMKRNRPEIWKKTSKILDAHGYLAWKLTAKAVASTTSIDAVTVYNIGRMRLSHSILAHLGLETAHFAEIQMPGSLIGPVTAEAAEATGLPEALPVIVAGGDGQCAGLGVHAISPGAVYLNLGTAIIAGIHTKDPRISRYWRTVTSPTGEGYFLEGCQRAGTFLIDWLTQKIGNRETSAATFAELETAAAALPVGSDGVTMSPYLMGCMDPHWDRTARASFHGLSADHDFTHLFRATLEATTLQTVRFIQAAATEGMSPDRIIAVGGGSSNALWTGMIADASALPVIQCLSREASSLGAAISAAVGVGWFADFEAAAQAMVHFGDRVEPNPAAKSEWNALSVRQAATYEPGCPPTAEAAHDA